MSKPEKSRLFRFHAAVLIVLGLSFGAKMAVEPRALKTTAKNPSLDSQQVTAGKSKPNVLGFDQWVAGMIWIHLLQNASVEPVAPGKVSWEYSRLLTLVQLDPKFESVYQYGASFLSVFRQDKIGAEVILQKWVTLRPRYWKAQYKLGFHLYSELMDAERAAPHILRAASLENSPPWLASLGVRLLSESGSLTHGINQAIELYSTLNSQVAKDRMLLRVSSLRYALEKSDWEARVKEFTLTRGHAPRQLSEVANALPRKRRSLANLVETRNELPPEVVRALAEPLEFRYDSLDKKVRLTDPEKEKLWSSVGIRRPKS